MTVRFSSDCPFSANVFFEWPQWSRKKPDWFTKQIFLFTIRLSESESLSLYRREIWGVIFWRVVKAFDRKHSRFYFLKRKIFLK